MMKISFQEKVLSKNPTTEKKKMSTRVVEALNAIDSVSTVHTRF